MRSRPCRQLRTVEVKLNHIVEPGLAAIVEVRGGVFEVAQRWSLETSNGVAQALVRGTVLAGATKLLMFACGLGLSGFK